MGVGRGRVGYSDMFYIHRLGLLFGGQNLEKNFSSMLEIPDFLVACQTR